MKVWVVEILDRGRWYPCSSLVETTRFYNGSVAVSREAAEIELEKWRAWNPDDKFRLRRYKRMAG